MTRREWKGPSAREELLLRWYMEQNLRALIRRRDRRLFNRFFAQQKKIKGFLGWNFKPQTDEQRLEDIFSGLDSIHLAMLFDSTGLEERER